MFLTRLLSSILITLFVAIVALLVISSVSIPGINIDARAVLSGSMAPAIPTGSVVFVIPSERYREGDIITFHRSADRLDVPVTHRILEVRVVEDEYLYTTKGDANEGADSTPVRYDQVLGKAAFFVPFLGYALSVAKTPYGFAALILLPAALIIGSEARKIWKEVRRRKKQAAGGEGVEEGDGREPNHDHHV